MNNTDISKKEQSNQKHIRYKEAEEYNETNKKIQFIKQKNNHSNDLSDSKYTTKSDTKSRNSTFTELKVTNKPNSHQKTTKPGKISFNTSFDQKSPSNITKRRKSYYKPKNPKTLPTQKTDRRLSLKKPKSTKKCQNPKKQSDIDCINFILFKTDKKETKANCKIQKPSAKKRRKEASCKRRRSRYKSKNEVKRKMGHKDISRVDDGNLSGKR
jgi:hypothetical protein